MWAAAKVTGVFLPNIEFRDVHYFSKIINNRKRKKDDSHAKSFRCCKNLVKNINYYNENEYFSHQS